MVWMLVAIWVGSSIPTGAIVADSVRYVERIAVESIVLALLTDAIIKGSLVFAYLSHG